MESRWRGEEGCERRVQSSGASECASLARVTPAAVNRRRLAPLSALRCGSCADAWLCCLSRVAALSLVAAAAESLSSVCAASSDQLHSRMERRQRRRDAWQRRSSAPCTSATQRQPTIQPTARQRGTVGRRGVASGWTSDRPQQGAGAPRDMQFALTEQLQLLRTTQKLKNSAKLV